MIFPITALELARLAQERLDGQVETVQQQMVDAYLPQTVEVILARQPECRALVKKIDPETLDRLVRNVAQLLWSQPGSMGGFRIEQQFVAAGLSKDDADTLATNVIRYSRYSMAIVNSIRHYRSAVSGIHDIVDPIQFRERYLGIPNLPEEKSIEWPKRAEEFGQERFKDSADLSDWLTRIEGFIAEVTSVRTWAKRKVLQDQDENGWNKASLISVSVAKAYTRRYGRYLMQEFKEVKLGGRYIPMGKNQSDTVLDELFELKNKLANDDKQVFALFEEDYESRSHRITSMTKPVARSKSSHSTGDFSYFEDYIGNQFKLEGRDLIIKSKPDKISSSLIDQMYRAFTVQLEVDSNLERFVSKADRDGQSLIVELENPKKSDALKLKQLLTKLLKA